MNDSRRRRIAQAEVLLSQAWEIIQEVAAEEREAYENMPAGLQDAERGQALSDNADALDSLADEIDSAKDSAAEIREGGSV